MIGFNITDGLICFFFDLCYPGIIWECFDVITLIVFTYGLLVRWGLPWYKAFVDSSKRFPGTLQIDHLP